MASYTPNYGLHQWVEEDNFLRTDFNTDLSKIDTAIKAVENLADGKASVVFGTYTGNNEDYQQITLGFKPRVLILVTRNGLLHDPSNPYYAVAGFTFQEMAAGVAVLKDTGFRVEATNGIHHPNSSQYSPYYYIAFR